MSHSLSRQQKWQQKMKAEGRCTRCGDSRPDGSFCAACREQRKLYSRMRAGCKPWTQGKPGRPPKGVVLSSRSGKDVVK